MEAWPEERQYAARAKQGMPVPSVELRLMREEGEAPSDGETSGEIEVRGPWIAGSYYNAPDQTVVGGRPETLQQLSQLLSVAGHKAQLLSVPCPYHTPLLEGAGQILKRTLDSLRMRPPRVPLLSTVTNRYVSDPQDIRANLAAQLTTPVRYVDLMVEHDSTRTTRSASAASTRTSTISS